MVTPDGHGPVVHDDGTVTFRVWAPRAEEAALVRGDRREALQPNGRGWWATTTARNDGRYSFSLDGGAPLPDPASRRQPEGVHAASCIVDPAAFPWSAQERRWQPPPLPTAVIYEMHVGTFTAQGTFDAALAHLPHLADLGITHVEVMPVNAFNGTYGWGYDGVAWYAVHEPYGGAEAFARFVDACHRHGLAVVLDVVYNHLGPSGNYLPAFGPYLTDRYRTPWGDALNLDGPGSDEVRAFILGSALAWLRDYHVDALRLDAVHGLVDQSSVHILTQLSAAVDALALQVGRPLGLIAESDRADPLTVTARELGGHGLDAQWADDLHHAIHVALTGERDGYYLDYVGLPDVARAYQRGFVYDGRYSPHRDRTVGAPLAQRPGYRLVTCIQNHDQVGNRAAGERLTTLVDAPLVRAGILLLCASPTTPMLFMGEEYGETAPFLYFTSHPEAELAEAVRKGRREEFASFTAFSGAAVPDPQDPQTRRRSVLDWDLRATPDGQAQVALWRDLLRLRREQPALANGRRDLVDVLEQTEQRLVLRRGDPVAPDVLVTVNLSADPHTVPVDGVWRLLCDTRQARYGGDDEIARREPAGLALPPASASLWLQQPGAAEDTPPSA